MFNFFTPHDFSSNPLALKSNTYKVDTGCGVMLKANDDYRYVYTSGLRTCVAFALINPTDQCALLVHFFHPTQIANDLKSIVSKFITESPNYEEGMICLIAGGRSFYDGSEAMCDELIVFAKKYLPNTTHPLKIQIHAPIVADDEETLSVVIDLKTGNSQMALHREAIASIDKPISTEHIEFTDLIYGSELLKKSEQEHQSLI